jgi:hypothetical protein
MRPSYGVGINKQTALTTTVAFSSPQPTACATTSRPDTPPGPRHEMVRNYREDGWESTDGSKGLGIHEWVAHEQKLGYLKLDSKLIFKDDLAGFFEFSKPYQAVPSFWQLVHWSNTELVKKRESLQEKNDLLAKRARETSVNQQKGDLLEKKREARRLKQKAMKARRAKRDSKKEEAALAEKARAGAAHATAAALEEAAPEAEMVLFDQDRDDGNNDHDSEETYSRRPLVIQDGDIEMEADDYFEMEREKKRSKRPAPANNEQVELSYNDEVDEFTALIEAELTQAAAMEVEGESQEDEIDDSTAPFVSEPMGNAVMEEDEVSSEEE